MPPRLRTRRFLPGGRPRWSEDLWTVATSADPCGARTRTVGASAPPQSLRGFPWWIPWSSRRLRPSHTNRFIEDLDVEKAVRAEPAEDLRIQELPLVARRVPVEGVEP